LLFATYTGTQLQQEVSYIHVSQAGSQVECGQPAVVIPPGHLGSRYISTLKKKVSSYIRKFRSGAVAKSYMRKGFLIYEEMRKYSPIYEEAVSHI
jgi:hypothetical protein